MNLFNYLSRQYALVIVLVIQFGYPAISLMAQDLLVTTKRDTLNCKMGKLKDEHYPITFIMDNELINGLIHMDSVFFFKKNVFRAMDNNKLRPWYPSVEIGFNAGGAHHFGRFRMDDDLTNKGVFAAKTGFYLGTDLICYISKHIGYGLKYNYRSLLDGDIRYQYFGPMMSFRFLEKNKPNHFFFSVSGGMGWMVQKNAPVQHLLLRPRIEMHAKSFSGDVAVGYSLRLAKHVNLRLKVSCNIGYPGFVKIQDLQKNVKPSDVPFDIGDYCHNMNTINLTVGFSITDNK